MVISAIQSHIRSIEKNEVLYEEKNFDKRIEAIDFIEFHIIDQLEDLLQKTTAPDELHLLKDRAEKIKTKLEEIDSKLFQKLRADIRSVGCAGNEFKAMINKYIDLDLSDSQHQQEAGYDNLDIFINGLFSLQAMPEQTKELELEMVYYQKTPARVVFEMAEQVSLMQEDIFFDLGSGLGQVAILVNLLTGVTVNGVEFEPAFCDYARDCATELNLPEVKFINTDARQADYSEGTIFFMFTPFRGEIMQEVLAALRKESLLRKIKIITYGPCTAEVGLQGWLSPVSMKDDNMYKLTVFTSC
ncbi:Histone methylation protein DOT1 [Mucilaginibacter mallensis]|uniref:Histone methylation protein DOT1 n=1 Tax=Mucilaginibacter mallensis TaxID=652787 RepID=A0A1H2BQ34_MUCMA|nr:class I SAM-dependent methyltransferase [Mucilaginibacter mallensis]SDT60234.1 Histone methylation protein DOT1 [Mucilaginibacter mallensis]